MPIYVAFLRGVMPTTLKMAALKSALESAGFGDVKTILASGNAVFSARKSPVPALERKVEAALFRETGRSFPTFIRSLDDLRALVESDPFQRFRLDPAAKPIVTLLRQAPPPAVRLPIEEKGVRILSRDGLTVFSAYVPNPGTADFMVLLQRTFGKEQTTRTWETVRKCAR